MRATFHRQSLSTAFINNLRVFSDSTTIITKNNRHVACQRGSGNHSKACLPLYAHNRNGIVYRADRTALYPAFYLYVQGSRMGGRSAIGAVFSFFNSILAAVSIGSQTGPNGGA